MIPRADYLARNDIRDVIQGHYHVALYVIFGDFSDIILGVCEGGKKHKQWRTVERTFLYITRDSNSNSDCILHRLIQYSPSR